MRLKNLLRKEGITPDLISLDQCFMVDPKVLKLIIKISELKKDEVVCEIGAGTGILTKKLSKYAGKVYAIEKDNRLYNILSVMLNKCDNVEIVIGDVKKYGFFKADKIIGNLPYTILDWFFKKLNKVDFKLGVFTIPLKFYQNQLEKYKNLSYKKVKVVHPASFYPQPRIKSVVILVKKK